VLKNPHLILLSNKLTTFAKNRIIVKKQVVLAHIALLLVQLIYASNHLLAKGVTPEFIGPDGFILVRMGTAMLLFLLVYLLFIREKVESKDWFRLIYTGVLGVGISQILFFRGIALTSAMNVGELMTAIPIATVLFSALILREKITGLKALGVFIGAIGAIAITVAGKQAAFDSSLGDVYIILNALVFGAYLVLTKPLMAKYNALTVVFYNFLFGFLFILFDPRVWSDIQHANFASFPSEIWLKIGFIILFATFITYLFNIFSLKAVSPSVSGSYAYLQPVFVVILTFVFALIGWTADYGKSITWEKIGYMLLIFLGVFLVARPSKN